MTQPDLQCSKTTSLWFAVRIILHERGAELFNWIVKCYQDVLGTMHDLDVFGQMIRNGGFSTDVERERLECMAAKRRERFRALRALMESSPLEMLGEKVRRCREA